jgi:dipeptidyl aminopeptidase/acylaminoacyl peptidase
VIDYLENRPDIDPQRIAIMGRSFGGYWAAKMAHVEAKRLRATVVWGRRRALFFPSRLAARIDQCRQLFNGS